MKTGTGIKNGANNGIAPIAKTRFPLRILVLQGIW